MEFIKGIELFLSKIDVFNGIILFFKTSEKKPESCFIEYWLRNYVVIGVFRRGNGITLGNHKMEHIIKNINMPLLKS